MRSGCTFILKTPIMRLGRLLRPNLVVQIGYLQKGKNVTPDHWDIFKLVVFQADMSESKGRE